MSLYNGNPWGNSGGGGGGTLPGNGSENTKGLVQFAAHNQSEPLLAVQSNDPRLKKEIIISKTEPIDKDVLWVDNNIVPSVIKMYNGASWSIISGSSSGEGGSSNVIISSSAPSDTNLIWVDNSTIPYQIKYYNTILNSWELLGGSSDSSDIKYDNSGFDYIKNVRQALDKLLYISPVINTFTNNINTVEKGTTVTNVNLNWSVNKTIVSQTLNNGIGSIDPSLRSYSVNGLSLTSDTNFTLTINDGENSVNKTTSVLFRQKRYWGTNSKLQLNDLDILSLSNNEFSSSRSQNRTINGNGEYIYFVYPASFGQASFKVNGLLSTAWNQETISFKNASGFTENYFVYRSNSIQNGTGIQIEIT